MLQDYNQTLRPAGTSLYPDSYREEDLICCGVFCQKERTVATHSFVYVMHINNIMLVSGCISPEEIHRLLRMLCK